MGGWRGRVYPPVAHEGGFGGAEPLRPFGTPPLSGEAFGVGAACSFQGR